MWSRERRGEGQVSPCSGTIQCVPPSPTDYRSPAITSDRRRPSGTGAHGDLFEGMMKIEFPTQKMIIIAGLVILIAADAILRSEEHTSELQSRLHLVCRLLLEKKKKRDPAHPDYALFR